MTAPHAPIALGRPVGPGHPPWIVAELSANHLGDLARAHAIVDAAAAAGCDAIKFQTFTPASMTLAGDGPGFRIERGPWAGRTLWDLYEEAHLPWAWHGELFAHARAVGLVPFSTPFDPDAVAALGELAPLVWKIASFEAGDDELIAACAATGRPIILSTGMASDDEVAHAVAAARGHGCRELILLHCVSGYPTPPEQMNLRRLTTLARLAPVGLSDHSPGAVAPIAAVALGACVIEKHLTLARADGGPDAGFSLEPDEMAEVVRGCRAAWAALGDGGAARPPVEAESRGFRRSLYAVSDIAVGEPLSRANVRAIRPGYGLAPRHLGALLGRPARVAIARGTPLAWELVA
ncbi:MAG: pseudaminic acid synthase [Kofleriaceae bacterium]|jgi:pseudaminic acid synthase|nr:pseudaminic acid synthase [Kofleriaceae bacterium]MBP9166737.1 pseudaminic acid synthase [Kofleriaceae bacterium]MBP9857159.1 pseudaminic acid synthase [Kofleriaceae bacterium]